MTLNRRTGYGHTLSVDAANGTSFTVLGAIVGGWSGPKIKKDAPDITVLSDTYKQYGVSQIDGGEVTFQIMWDPDEASSTTVNTLLAQMNQVPANWKVTYGAGPQGSGTIVTETFHAHVVGVSKEVKVGNALVSEITLKITGVV